ncbi:hypothetical protein JKP88DRAFT_309416 [Tribonema minus]|uniref:dDENN domain-containing protein n=1 Tax=Tribonema minus TaxID=303371 RepID=A0A835Z7Z8_9STRA|nr:hypothetical protein JKP88DRAFT_309416 [Tribonema minus]
MEDFLATVAPSVRPFLERITTTQMFWVLVQQLLESSERDDQLVFFEECVTVLRNRQAGAVAICGRTYEDAAGGAGPTPGDTPMPLLDEVRLKRTDLYPGSSAAGVSLGTPMATPVTARQAFAAGTNGGAGSAASTVPAASSRRPQSMRLAMVMSALEPELSPMDSTAPPLVIPGPTKLGLPARDAAAVYSYANGWPTPLNRDLLRTPPEALPAVVLKLQTYSLAYRELHGRRQHGRGAPLGTSLMYG